MSEVTRLIEAAHAGDRKAAADLLPLVYDELRKLAATKMAGEMAGHTLDATALVHEAYLRLVGPIGERQFCNRRHFFAAAAEAMRRILIESARQRAAETRGRPAARGRRSRRAGGRIPDGELLALHDALERFAIHDPVKAQLIELRFFGGLSLPEIAEHLGMSLSTAERGWRYARAWLYTAMADEEKPSPE